MEVVQEKFIATNLKTPGVSPGMKIAPSAEHEDKRPGRLKLEDTTGVSPWSFIKLHNFLSTPSLVRTWTVVLLLILAVAIPATINLAINPQDIRQRAQEVPTTPPSPPIPPTNTPPVSGPDGDNDGFTDLTETFMGTDPLDACADSRTDDAWPPDFDNNTVINAVDTQKLLAFLKPASPSAATTRHYNKRFDLNTDGDVSILDYNIYQAYIGQRCAGGVTGIPRTRITPQVSKKPLR